MHARMPIPAGSAGRDRVVDVLADRLPAALRPLADLAYDYRWSWTPGADSLFRALDPRDWERLDRNPVRQLIEAAPERLARLAADDDYLARLRAVTTTIQEDLDRPAAFGMSTEHPVAFLCAEFGVHQSLPIYSGGLGVLAGDILKEASDLALPMVGVGLLYRRGYFHQRLDHTGWQHEYWLEADTDLLPVAPVLGDDGHPLRFAVEIRGREVAVRVWRVDVGRVPLFLLDTDVDENSPVDRWITSRLYESNRDVRLSQYALLGIGGVRLLELLGIEPSTIHLNEGHAALAALELATGDIDGGAPFDAAIESARRRVVFTTHTPVAAGNETYPADQVLDVLGGMSKRLGIDPERFLGLGRVDPDDPHAEAGMTPIALRLSRRVNGVSEIHGRVARDMWAPLFGVAPDDVPITHVTNGVHLPTWMSAPVRDLLDGYLGAGWTSRATDPDTWAAVDDIPDREVWQARTEARGRLVRYVRDRLATDRLARGEDIRVVERAAETLDEGTLTIGFARRVAAYKRLYLLRYDPERLIQLLDGPTGLQLMFAGKAHPADDGAKAILRSMFEIRDAPQVAERIAFLEDYGIGSGAMLTMGADVWVNVPRPPLEASGTSGMKSALNGGLNLSVLDGWWAEVAGDDNGWSLPGDVDYDHGAQDHRHADQFYRILEDEVVPRFHERDADGVPLEWVRRIKATWRSVGPRFCATRMMHDYVDEIYTAG